MDSVLDYFNNFEFVHDVTPLSNWVIPISCSIFYLLMVFFGQKMMKNREPIRLKTFAFFHNWFLCILSFMMVAGVTFEYLYALIAKPTPDFEYPVFAVMCDPTGYFSKSRINFWTYVFYISKAIEFIDTLLMILKKQKLIFLHVYHHMITLVLVWVGLYVKMAIQSQAVITNGFIHILMYYYYSQATIGRKIWWKKYLTSLQIIQFVLDLILPQFWLYYALTYGNCTGSFNALWFGEAIIFSFLYLFIDFYKKEYIEGKRVAAAAKEAAAKEAASGKSTESSTDGSAKKRQIRRED